MSDTATLSRLFSSIDADLEIVDQTFQLVRRLGSTFSTPLRHIF